MLLYAFKRHMINLTYPPLHEQYADTMQEIDPSPFFSNIQVNLISLSHVRGLTLISLKRHSYCRSQHTSHPERTHLGAL